MDVKNSIQDKIRDRSEILGLEGEYILKYTTGRDISKKSNHQGHNREEHKTRGGGCCIVGVSTFRFLRNFYQRRHTCTTSQLRRKCVLLRTRDHGAPHIDVGDGGIRSIDRISLVADTNLVLESKIRFNSRGQIHHQSKIRGCWRCETVRNLSG